MIYILTLALAGLSLALAVGAGFNELRRLNSELEIEKTKQLTPLEVMKAETEGGASQRAEIAKSIDESLRELQTAGDELNAFHSREMQFSSLPKVQRLLKSVQRNLKDLSDPEPGNDLVIHGLEYSLRRQLERISGPQVRIGFESSIGSDRYPHHLEVYIFQACSELVQNTIKHSNAQHCLVSLTQRPYGLELLVKDNGTTSLNSSAPKPGFGLTRLKIKCEKYGGAFAFQLTANGAETAILLPCVNVSHMAMA